MAPEHETALELLAYDRWCNDHVMVCLAALPDSTVHREMGFGLRTMHRSMAHIADVLQGWGGCVGPDLRAPTWIPYDASEPVAALRRRLAQIGDSVLASARAAASLGCLSEQRRLHQVFHLVTHGTHHRGQVLSMLTILGHSHPFEGGDFGGWSKVRTAGN